MRRKPYIIEFRGKPGIFDNPSKSWTTWRRWKSYKTVKSQRQALEALSNTTYYGKKYFEYRIEEKIK
jgi:hypothetical protein